MALQLLKDISKSSLYDLGVSNSVIERCMSEMIQPKTVCPHFKSLLLRHYLSILGRLAELQKGS